MASVSRPAGLSLLLFYGCASFVPAAILALLVILSEASGGTESSDTFSRQLSFFIPWGVWFSAAVAIFWRFRKRNAGAAPRWRLVLGCTWGFIWWLLPYGWFLVQKGKAGAVFDGVFYGSLAAGVITCPVLWVVTRSPWSVLLAAMGAATIFTGVSAILLWPACVYAGLALWAADSPRRLGESLKNSGGRSCGG
jgi:hypothetical protein